MDQASLLVVSQAASTRDDIDVCFSKNIKIAVIFSGVTSIRFCFRWQKLYLNRLNLEKYIYPVIFLQFQHFECCLCHYSHNFQNKTTSVQDQNLKLNCEGMKIRPTLSLSNILLLRIFATEGPQRHNRNDTTLALYSSAIEGHHRLNECWRHPIRISMIFV